MHTFHAQPVSRFTLANHSGFDWAAALGRLRAFAAALLGRCTRGKHDAVPHYEGYAWCDLLERQLNSDIATCRRARL